MEIFPGESTSEKIQHALLQGSQDLSCVIDYLLNGVVHKKN